MKLPVGKAIATSFAYFATHIVTILKLMWLPALMLQAGLIYVMPGYFDAAMALSSVAPSTDPSAAFAVMGPMFSRIGAVLLLSAAFYPMLIAGSLRHIIRGEGPRLPFYLQYGGDEIRIAIAFVLLGVVVGILGFVAMLSLAALSAALIAVSPAIGGVIASIAPLAVLITLLWFMLRMSMVFPATIGTKQIGLGKSWAMTKGNAWRLFFYWLIWMVIIFCVAVAYMTIAWPDYFGFLGEMMAKAQDPAAVQETQARMIQMQRDLWDVSKPGFWPFTIATYVYLIVYVALWNTASGIAYRYLASEQ